MNRELERIRRQADSTIGHARKCKLAPSECLQCSQAIAYYASLPLATLALVLEDRPILKQSR
jgi:hypothetical protein